MIGKMLGMLATLLAAVCVATVIAAAVLLCFYARSWKVTSARFGRAVAVLQGKNLDSFLPPPAPKKETEGEQPSYDQVLDSQSLKSREIEQREAALRTNIQQFQEDLGKIVEERKRVQTVRDDLQARLDEINKSATAAGSENVEQTLQTLKPKQAKELIAQRLEKGDVDVMARMLADMSDRKRAKIIAEFKSPSEMEQIGEVLNHIRQGQPAKALIDETDKKLQPPSRPGP